MYGTDPTVTADGPLPVQRPNLLTLNWDVLWHIFAHLTRGDVIQLGKTCHAAHTISWPYVLAEVALSEPSQVLPFCTYMLSDAEHRLPLLRSLKIRQGTFLDTWKSPNAWDFSVAEHLARLMLRLSTTLRELYVQDAEKIFCSLPRIADAVIALTRLEVFRLEGALQESATVLSRMRSRPHSVDWDARLYERWPSLPGLGSLLSLTPEQQQAVAFGEGPCHILRNFATSLTTLKLRDLCRTITAYEPDIVWHAVKTLELYKQSIGFDVPPAAVMVELSRAFPNLQCLRVTGNMGIAPHPVNAVQESGCWPYLDFVSTISPMPVVRTVRRLELHNSADRVPFYVQEHTCEEFLRLSAPVVLACGADEEILQSIHAAAIPSLRFLQLFFYPITRGSLPERHAVHMQHILDTVFPKLKAIPLHAVTMSIKDAYDFSPPFDAISVQRYATDIAGCIPSLEYVGLQRNNGPWDEFQYQWFRVATRTQGGGMVLEKLSEYAAGALELKLLATPRE